MSLSDLDVKQIYSGDGSTTQFAIPFAYIEGDEATVIKVYKVLISTGVKTLQTITTHYTITGALVEFLVAPSALYKVLIRRTMPLVQPTEYSAVGRYDAEGHEESEDKLAMLIQQVDEIAQRSVRVPDSVASASFDPEFPADVALNAAGKLPIVNADGDGWDDAENWPTGDDIENAEENALAAAASAAAAAVSAAAALASQILAATYAPIPGGPFTVVHNAGATALTGEVTDSAIYNQVDYVARIVRGTTVFARVEFSIFYRNGSWRLATGESRYEWFDHGITFTVHAVTGQISAAAAVGEDDVSSNATIDIIKTLWAA